MSLFLSKILAQLAYPLSLAVLLMGLAWLLGFRSPRAGRWLLGSAFLLLWAASAPVVSDHLRASLERRYLPVPMEAMPSADAIVVLGGGIGDALPPRLSLDLNRAADRVLYAARLYRAGKGKVVIASGGNLPWLGSTPEAILMAEFLQDLGVPREAILLETKSRNTYENAIETRRLMEARRLETALLVTSALHMPRAFACFKAAGIEAMPAPTDFEVVDRPYGTLLDFLPDARALEGATRAVKEYLGLWVYGWRGWLG